MRLLQRRQALRVLSAGGAALVAPCHAKAAGPPRFYGYNGQYTQLQPPIRVPQRPILTAGGTLIEFSSLRGKVVLMNFWATWCVPCIYEMPSLDRLQANLSGDSTVKIMPVSMDTGGGAVVAAFYRRLDLTHLGIFTDPAQQIGYFRTSNPGHAIFRLYALPITYMIDPHGLVRGYVPGAAKWDSPESRGLIEYLRKN